MKYIYDTTTRQQDDQLNARELNHMGARGWELISIVSHKLTLTYYFKKTVKP